MTDSKASMLMRWKIASRRMPALLTTPSSLPKLSIAILTILLAGIASATVSKFATAVPPRFLISSTTSSAGVAEVPEPSAAPPGSLTTTLAPSAAQSSAISRPIPRPAPVTMTTLSCSDLVLAMVLLPLFLRHSGAREARTRNLEIPRCAIAHLWSAPSGASRNDELLPFVRKNNRATCPEHAADAVADRNLRARHLRRRDAAHLPHALLQRIHAVHAGMHVAETAAIGIQRQLAAGPGVAVGDELAGFFMRHEAEIAEAIQRQMRKRVVDHQVIDIPMGDAGLLEGERARDLERTRTVEGLHLADHRRFHALAGAEDIDRLGLEILGAVGRGQDQRAAAVGDEAALQDAERIGDHPRVQHILDRDRRLHGGARILRGPFTLHHRDHRDLLMGDAVGLHVAQHRDRKHAGRPVDAEWRFELAVQAVRRRRTRLLADHRLAALGVGNQHGLAKPGLD